MLSREANAGLASPQVSNYRDFVTIRSVLSTARKQGWNLLETLLSEPVRLGDRLRWT